MVAFAMRKPYQGSPWPVSIFSAITKERSLTSYRNYYPTDLLLTTVAGRRPADRPSHRIFRQGSRRGGLDGGRPITAIRSVSCGIARMKQAVLSRCNCSLLQDEESSRLSQVCGGRLPDTFAVVCRLTSYVSGLRLVSGIAALPDPACLVGLGRSHRGARISSVM